MHKILVNEHRVRLFNVCLKQHKALCILYEPEIKFLKGLLNSNSVEVQKLVLKCQFILYFSLVQNPFLNDVVVF